MKIIIVGTGVVGCVIGNHLQAQGHEVIWIGESRRPIASICSGGMMRPTWTADKVGNSAINEGLNLLNNYYGLTSHILCVRSLKTNKRKNDGGFISVDMNNVLNVPRHEATIVSVSKGAAFANDGREFKGDVVIIAAGYWAGQLVPSLNIDLKGQQGIAFSFKRAIAEPLVAPWRPYRAVLAFNPQPDRCWASDGTAILPANWSQEHEAEAQKRVLKITRFKEQDIRWARVGIRPYLRGEPGICERVSKGIWVATGGSKNSTILSTIWAVQIAKALKKGA